jgi:outer membrane receptor protein involved in Fe transport
MGIFNFSVDATYVESYRYRLRPELAEVEGVGSQNSLTNAVPPMPYWKANVGLGWTLNDHSVNFTTRYIGEMDFNSNKFDFQARLPFSNYREVDVLRASTIVDASYNYRGFETMGGEVSLTVGARNLFDRLPQKVPMLGGMESILYDPTGRMLYGRITFEM